MKSLILIILTVVFSLSIQAQSTLKKALSEISADLAQKISLKGKKKIVILFVNEIDKTPTIAGKYIADYVSVEIVNNPANFQVFDRENLNSIVEAKKLIAEGYIDVDKTKELGRLLAVEAIVVGNYTVLSNTLSLTLKSLDVIDGFVIAAAMKDLPLDNDAGALLGINVSTNNGAAINNSNRGYNNIPLNSNENYNNPETVDKSCLTNNTGDFCFKNNTNKRIRLSITQRQNASNRLTPSSENSIILEVGETKCMYALYSCPTSYSVVKETQSMGGGRTYFPTVEIYTSGQILVERCKSKTLEIR